jgi:GTP-dependent phosphoenolpyruvate carboxykinase
LAKERAAEQERNAQLAKERAAEQERLRVEEQERIEAEVKMTRAYELWWDGLTDKQKEYYENKGQSTDIGIETSVDPKGKEPIMTLEILSQ